MSIDYSTQVHLARRPSGWPQATDFLFSRQALAALQPGEVLVENLYLSVDPYMRENMDATWQLNSPLEGRSVGRVVRSRQTTIEEGALVFHRAGWRTHAVLNVNEVRVLPHIPGVPPSVFLAALGGTGLTAFAGLTQIAKLEGGETLFVSAGGGGVGNMVGQIARLLGAGKVIGSTGSAAKATFLVHDLGFDAAFDYHDGIAQPLRNAAGDGINVYFDNVGGDHLAAAIDALTPSGKIVWCGAVAQYNTPTSPSAPRNLFQIVDKSLTLQGFLVRNYRHLQAEFEDFIIPHLSSGRIKSIETITEGFDNIVYAFIAMLQGKNLGKALVKIT
ncbi:NADP-dependent oxidoreductase [Neokomagataea thailandica]|uniref:Alcohol dehydrogenase n=1 Tax=Neokomagataea tanensis NBRC 106556 TaxID=1223519 RepID=A0ABQ0QL57_9PROT|nr:MULTISPECIES: NADP-dependent oxidoreductase [Neokomagataea]GBR48942.1 alcohol dehydrogenase [Neokomagataea tanensis NBRC 106556]